jgi:iron complex outermembrane receptor protein
LGYLVKKLILLSSAAFVLPTAAFAQSTGSVDFERETIVVTGTRTQEVGGVQSPDTTKAKAVLTQEIIARQNPGQTILDTINLVPGVSFQNNDAYGSSGGTLNIRGFDSSRVSLTFDGIPLNDSGNYAIYSNQQLDPELIEQVNVNLGTTDVDSPTASAVGGTVNYRSLMPSRQMGGRFSVSIGEFDFRRFFGLFQTGELTSYGTRAWVSASTAKNDNPFNNYGKVDKQQYNGKVYQPIGDNGDFIAVAGHYNQNRNNFFGSLPLRRDLAVPSGFPQSRDEREYDLLYPCQIDVPQAGVADAANSCAAEFDRRYNPSNTGNIRGSSRFTLTDKLTLTVDPSFQYVKANGGGTSTSGREGTVNIGGVASTGFVGGSYYFNRDLNGDGDQLDRVRILNPSQTRTRRIGVIAGLRWDINDDHLVRFGYTFDRANHRQTGETGLLEVDGEPMDVFPVNDPLADVNGNVLQKRDRQSYAILHQVAGEYVGSYMEDRLTLTAGARLPFFKRDLENFCFTTAPNGNLDCFNQDPTLNDRYADANPTIQGPQRRVLKYNEVLPNVGVVYDFTPQLSGFASYAKGLSVPGTDNLYNAFFFPADTDEAKPDPETTDTFDAGVRFRSSKIQAQIAGWFTRFNDRLASAYDPELDRTVYRNLGQVDKYGIDASVAYAPINELTLYAFGSLNKSEIKDDVQSGSCTAAQVLAGSLGCTVIGQPIFVPTKGKREGGAPKYNYGGSVLGKLGPVDLGLTAKRTGPRFIYDTNQPVVSGGNIVFPKSTPAYWLVSLDARLNMGHFDAQLDKTYLQFNVYNLFDKLYVGGFGSSLDPSSGAPFAQIGAPRTISLTASVGF